MGRVINYGETPAKRRRAALRSCAEVLRALAQRPSLHSGNFDEEAKDMAAFISFNLQTIGDTIEESAHAWDDRNYWKKSEKLRADWRWAPRMSADLAALIRAGDWAEVPPLLLQLAPHLADITIVQTTRDSDWWCGAYRALIKEGT